SPRISPWPALPGLAGLKAHRPQAQSFAAGGSDRNQDSERQYLPCRGVAEVQDSQGEIKAEGPQHIEAAAGPKEARFEKSPNKARRHSEPRQRLGICAEAVARQYP